MLMLASLERLNPPSQPLVAYPPANPSLSNLLRSLLSLLLTIRYSSLPPPMHTSKARQTSKRAEPPRREGEGRSGAVREVKKLDHAHPTSRLQERDKGEGITIHTSTYTYAYTYTCSHTSIHVYTSLSLPSSLT
ncbi:hypothetical protein EON63_11805, partial [archaeon]